MSSGETASSLSAFRPPAGLRRLRPVADVAALGGEVAMIKTRTTPVALMKRDVITALVAGDATITGRRRVVATDAMRRLKAGRAPSGIMRSWTILGMA